MAYHVEQECLLMEEHHLLLESYRNLQRGLSESQRLQTL